MCTHLLQGELSCLGSQLQPEDLLLHWGTRVEQLCPWGALGASAAMPGWGMPANALLAVSRAVCKGRQAPFSSVFRVSLWGLAGVAGPPTAAHLSATQHPRNTDQHGPCSGRMTEPCRSSVCRGHGQISSAWLWPCGVRSRASVCSVLRRGLPIKWKPRDERSGGLVKQRFFHNTHKVTQQTC